MSQRALARFQIQGKTVELPVEVRDASSAAASFVVPSESAQRFVGDAFEVAEFLPKRTLFFLICIDYKDNDLGNYNEVALNFFVRQKAARKGIPSLSAWRGLGNGSLSTYCYKMPVNQSFTRDAGAEIWGFPKTVERIDFDYATPGRFRALLEMGGEKVFELDLPRGGTLNPPAMGMSACTYINGIPHVTSFRQTMKGTGVKLGGRGVRLDLGSHSVANDLRSLGLPKKPLMTLWTEKLTLSFGPAEKLEPIS